MTQCLNLKCYRGWYRQAVTKKSGREMELSGMKLYQQIATRR